MLKIPYSKQDLQSIIDLGLETGGDFVELFFEDTIENTIDLTMDKVSDVKRRNIHGVAVRILKGEQTVNGYTNDINEVKQLVTSLASSFNDSRVKNAQDLKEVEKDINTKFIVNPIEVDLDTKISYFLKAYEAASKVSSEIVQIMIKGIDKYQDILVCNSDGVYASDVRTNIRCRVTCVASDKNDQQIGSADVGGNTGYELFENTDFSALGEKAAKQAVTILHADYIKGGKMDVVIHNGFGGVILHEACVHSLEATSVAKNASVFCNKLGQKIASDVVTAVDDGTLLNYWGSTNIDDEGKKTQRNVLIENGVLKSYLVDYRNARIMNHPTTGSGRRQSYKYLPTSRMSNTFIVNGNSTYEEIIANTKYGLFAKDMGGGSVNPATGEFNFAVLEGWLIEDGKLTKPVKGATLVGPGSEVLLNIDMVGNNLSTGHGMCGSSSGSIPTDVGQPTIRVKNVTVGGKN